MPPASGVPFRSILKIGQNIKYDMGILSRYGIDVRPFDDTMLMAYALDGARGNGMDALSQAFLDHTPIAFKDIAGTGKAQKTFNQLDIDTATRYAAEDADVTLRLWQVLKPRLVAEHQTNVYETLERPLVPVLKTEVVPVSSTVLQSSRTKVSPRVGM